MTNAYKVCYNRLMKNNIVITAFLAITALVLPGVSFAQYNGNTAYYPQGGFYEAPPVKTEGVVITTNQNSGSTNTQTYTVTNPADSLPTFSGVGSTLGINIKSKAQKDQEKAAAEAAKARAAEDARVAKNSDGTFAYGYTNGTGTEYVSGTTYTDARYATKNGSKNVAAAGSLFSGKGFLPQTAGGWVLVIFLMTILFAIVKAFSDRLNSRKTHTHAHAH